MSLFRQLWLVISISVLIAFTGSLIANMLTARHYLNQQLTTKNNDNAAWLASSMSQQNKNPLTIERQIAATFASGQYAAVRLTAPSGQLIIEKTSSPLAGDAPPWFIHTFPIAAQPGQAQVYSGSNPFGTIELISHSQLAYQALWNGALNLLGGFIIGGTLLGLLGTQLLRRRLKQPLDAIVSQLEAIGDRHLRQLSEPATPELQSLARTMNATVDRLKTLFSEAAAHLEQARREAALDSLTGLANRAYFLNQLDAALNSDDAIPSGSLLILHLTDLTGINRRAGREATDELLRRLGSTLNDLTKDQPSAAAARLNGAEFALLLPGIPDPTPQVEKLLGTLCNLAGLIDNECIGHIASGIYLHGQNIGNLLARLDVALASAESQGGPTWCRAENPGQQGPTSNADWKKLLQGAIATQRLRLVEFPVASSAGQLLHLECPLRLQANAGGEWLTAGSFIPMASRLTMTTELDLAAARLALERIAAGAAAVAVNLSGESIFNAGFRQRLQTLISARQALAPRLWLEVSEVGAFLHFAEFKAFCDALRPLGCRLGIEHFGRQFCEIGRLHDIGLTYLKVDGSFIHAINTHPGNQTFLKGLCSIAHNMGLTVIAEGVQTAAELATLPELGFDGATGPAVPRN